MHTLLFNKTEIIADCEGINQIDGGYLLTGASVRLTLPNTPRYYYHHGWQSWSLTAWAAPQALPEQKPALLRPMQLDPVYAHHPSPHGNWLGAVDFEDGNILLLGALGLEAHVQLRESQLQGWNETGQPGLQWFAAYGPEQQVFAAYATMLEQVFGKGRALAPYRVWCSWYSLYTAIDAQILSKTFHALNGLPFDVLQVDDGWQAAIGDWEANQKFPAGMQALANEIKATGRKAGLWLAPLIAVESSRLFRQNPGWFLRDEAGRFVSAGFNWGEPLYTLDVTHPEALAWLAGLMKQTRAWGYDYLKLDFLYAGALPGKRHTNLPRETAYRSGLAAIREALGEEAYLLTCGAPILPSLGLCDGMRIGPDVAAHWESERDAHWLCNPTTPGAKNAIRTSLHRLWLAPLVHADPDVVYFRATENQLAPQQKALLQNLAHICRFKATSDLPQWWSAAEREAAQTFLQEQPAIRRTGRYTFQVGGQDVDFTPAASLPLRRKKSLTAAFTLWGGEQKWLLRRLDAAGKNQLQKLKKDWLS